MQRYNVTYDLITRLFGQQDKRIRLKREVAAETAEEAGTHVESECNRQGYGANIIRCTEA